MISIALASIITCSQAYAVIKRLAAVPGLSQAQRDEILHEIRQTIPTCPVTIKKDEPVKKQSNRSDD